MELRQSRGNGPAMAGSMPASRSAHAHHARATPSDCGRSSGSGQFASAFPSQKGATVASCGLAGLDNSPTYPPARYGGASAAAFHRLPFSVLAPTGSNRLARVDTAIATHFNQQPAASQRRKGKGSLWARVLGVLRCSDSLQYSGASPKDSFVDTLAASGYLQHFVPSHPTLDVIGAVR